MQDLLKPLWFDEGQDIVETGGLIRSGEPRARGPRLASSYRLDTIESCLICNMRGEGIFCALGTTALQAFERVTFASTYPKDTILFMEGQAPCGVFVLCSGEVRISLCTGDGKRFIFRHSQPGDVLGLSATLSGKLYEFTAETVEPCQVKFVKREDFIRFLKDNSDACFKATEQLSFKYSNACHEVRSLGLSQSVGEKLAKLLLEWRDRNGGFNKTQARVRVTITHDEIAQMIGSCRETVTRLFADLKKRRIVEWKGSTLLIRDVSALKALADNRCKPLLRPRDSASGRLRALRGRLRPAAQQSLRILQTEARRLGTR
jgi:CRP/FNR family cyclic AMP-dependent transcriptional regulator